MSSFILKKLISEGKNKTKSEVYFSDHLTIIFGASNTGKTYIFKIINFIFGDSKLDISKNCGYNTFSLEIEYENKPIVFTRKINSKMISVVSEYPDIHTDTYTIDLDGEKPINTIFLKLLGINDCFKVPYNKNCEMKRFTFRSFLHLMMIKETEIERATSIILPKETTNKTFFLSHLLFLLYLQDFSSFDPDEKDNVKRAKKDAIKGYITDKLLFTQQRIAELNKLIDLETCINVKERIQFLNDELQKIENAIKDILQNGQELLQKIQEKNEKMTECNMLINRFEALESQYLSDIKRLSFIAESNQLMASENKLQTCPFCNHVVEDTIYTIDIETFKQEIIRIKNQLDDLLSTKNYVLMEKDVTKNEIIALSEEKKKLDKLINTELRTKQNNLSHQIECFEEYIRLTSELDILNKINTEWENDLDYLDKKIEKKTVYKPLELFPSNFENDISKIVQDILKECNFQKYYTAKFSTRTFDIEINGGTKDSNGKGYVAFFNSVLILAIRKYIYDISSIKLPFYIIDTPLLGLDVGDAEINHENIRIGIYQYFMKSVNQSQLIIIDNKKDMPNLNFNQQYIHLVYYSHNEKDRYGYFIDHRD